MLEILHGTSSKVDGQDSSVHHAAVETATLQYPSDTVHDHEVAVAQSTGIDASRELSLKCATLQSLWFAVASDCCGGGGRRSEVCVTFWLT